jgi:predicted alpha/beta superfamily hydrolase
MQHTATQAPARPWRDYTDDYTEQKEQADRAPHTVTGTLLVDARAPHPQLGVRRPLYVWLPPSYATAPERRYPVLYMHDAQNLFDAALAFGGREWQVDESLTALAAEGMEAIVVGISHGGRRRVRELTPFGANNLGEAYLACITDTIKPRVDATFRTLPERDHTTMVGSSMGGLMSLFAFFHRPDLFGAVGVLSPALWPAHGAIGNMVRRAPYVPGRIYLDNGTHEPSARPMAETLRTKGYNDANLRYVVDKGGHHSEADWARRLPNALRFLLAPDVQSARPTE